MNYNISFPISPSALKFSQGTLTKGDGSVQLTSFVPTKFISAAFAIENPFHLFLKQATLMRRSTVLSLPLH